MGINPKQLDNYIITPTLVKIGLYSEAALNLLMGTCAQESQMGTYLKQINGIALGIYQMEKPTHDDIWDNYLSYNTSLAGKAFSINNRDSVNLIHDLAYATAMARIHYLRVKEPLPEANDLRGLAHYYKKYYNTDAGAATEQQFIDNYNRYVKT